MSVTETLRDCRELEYILLGDLRDLLDENQDEQTAHWMKVLLDTLLETMPREFALRTENGYLTAVLDDFPNWEPQVSRLEDEYFALYRRLRQLRRRLALNQDYAELAAPLTREMLDWMAAFRRHLQSEQRLVLLAANLETGGGD